MRVVTNVPNRHEKKHRTLEMLLRADFLRIFEILHFSRFLKSSIAHAKIVEIVLFLAEHGRRTRLSNKEKTFTLLSPFVIEKQIEAMIGEAKSVEKNKKRNLLVETTRKTQTDT